MSHQIKSKHYFNLEWQMTTLKTKRWSKPNVLTCRSSLLYNVSVEHSEANSFRDPTSLSLSLCMSKEHLSLTCFPHFSTYIHIGKYIVWLKKIDLHFLVTTLAVFLGSLLAPSKLKWIEIFNYTNVHDNLD